VRADTEGELPRLARLSNVQPFTFVTQ